MYRTRFFSLKDARIGMARLGIDRLEIGLYTAFLALKCVEGVCFLEVTNITKGEMIMNPKWCCCNEQCIEDTVNLNLKM